MFRNLGYKEINLGHKELIDYFTSKNSMKIQLLTCDAPRPDGRAIAKTLEEIALGIDGALARELTGYLLDGTEIDIEVDDKTTSSAFRALRKVNIDYQILED